eukprot:5741838-Amphidinium_carterae.1
MRYQHSVLDNKNAATFTELRAVLLCKRIGCCTDEVPLKELCPNVNCYLWPTHCRNAAFRCVCMLVSAGEVGHIVGFHHTAGERQSLKYTYDECGEDHDWFLLSEPTCEAMHKGPLLCISDALIKVLLTVGRECLRPSLSQDDVPSHPHPYLDAFQW